MTPRAVDNDKDTGKSVIIFVIILTVLGEIGFIINLFLRDYMKIWRRIGIEPNEHQTPRFQGKYSYHTHLTENPERPNSPNVLPMSRVMLGCGKTQSEIIEEEIREGS